MSYFSKISLDEIYIMIWYIIKILGSNFRLE